MLSKKESAKELYQWTQNNKHSSFTNLIFHAINMATMEQKRCLAFGFMNEVLIFDEWLEFRQIHKENDFFKKYEVI